MTMKIQNSRPAMMHSASADHLIASAHKSKHRIQSSRSAIKNLIFQQKIKEETLAIELQDDEILKVVSLNNNNNNNNRVKFVNDEQTSIEVGQVPPAQTTAAAQREKVKLLMADIIEEAISRVIEDEISIDLDQEKEFEPKSYRKLPNNSETEAPPQSDEAHEFKTLTYKKLPFTSAQPSEALTVPVQETSVPGDSYFVTETMQMLAEENE